MEALRDQALSESVRRRLMEDTRLGGQSITVVASGGFVQLEGMVVTEENKELAEELAIGVTGVRHVENLIEVRESTDESELE